MTQVLVYPAFNARYYAHFVEGLRALARPGGLRLRYTTEGFPRLGPNCLALRVGPGRGARIYVHSQDPADLDPVGLAWCDVFGKVNLDPDGVPDGARGKLVALGPMFPFRAGGATIATWRGLVTYWQGGSHCNRFRKHVGDHRGQSTTRLPESAYLPGRSRSDYVFFNSTLWEFEEEGNAVRARFVEAARSVPGVEFEGGLSPRDSVGGEKGWTAPEFQPYLSRRYPYAEYLAKTRRSAVGLNNPSCLDCHSWKFAEQLALGKAIISTPLRRAVPAPLVHGEHIHYVDGSVASFRAAIRLICGDDAYRQRLERNAREYFESYLTPARMVERLLEAAGVPLAAAAGSERGGPRPVSPAAQGQETHPLVTR